MFQQYSKNSLSDADQQELSNLGYLFEDFFRENITLDPDKFVVREAVMNAFVDWRQKRKPVMKFTELDQAAEDIGNSFDPSQFRSFIETESDAQQAGVGGCNVFYDCWQGYEMTYVLPETKQIEPQFRPAEPEECTKLYGDDGVDNSALQIEVTQLRGEVEDLKERLDTMNVKMDLLLKL